MAAPQSAVDADPTDTDHRRQFVPCRRCQTPVDRDDAVRRIDGELYHPGCTRR